MAPSLLLGLGGLAFAELGPALEEQDVVSSAPLTTSGHLPQCVGDSSCLMQFTVAPDGGCAAFAGNGRDFSPNMNQGTAPTFAATGFVPSPGGSGVMARTNITDTSACYLPAAAAVDAGLAAAIAGDHAVQCAYWSDSATAVPFSYGQYGTTGMYWDNGATTTFRWIGQDAGNYSKIVAVAATGQWVVASGGRSGTSLFGRVNGTITSAVSDALVSAPTTKPVALGFYGPGGNPNGGALTHCTLWSSRSAADLTRDEARFMGGIAEARNVTTTRASAAWLVDLDGGVRGFGVNAPRVDARGDLSYVGEANALAQSTGYDTAATWVPLGTVGAAVDAGMNPVVTANTADVLDPMGTNTAEKVVFHETLNAGDASALQQGFTGTAVAWSGSNVFLRTASGTATVYLYSYTGSSAPPANALATCSVTTAWAPCAWLGATLSAATYQFSLGVDLRATIGTGQTAKAAQTVYVWGGKAALGSVSGPVVNCGAAPCSTAADQSLVPSAGYPTTSGRIRLTYTPMHTSASVRCLIDTISSNNGLRLCTAADNTLVLTLGDGSATGTVTSAALTWTGGTAYVLDFDWGGGTAFVRKAGVLVASTTSAAKIPTAHAANAGVGQVIGGTSSANGWVKVLSVGRR